MRPRRSTRSRTPPPTPRPPPPRRQRQPKRPSRPPPRTQPGSRQRALPAGPTFGRRPRRRPRPRNRPCSRREARPRLRRETHRGVHVGKPALVHVGKLALVPVAVRRGSKQGEPSSRASAVPAVEALRPASAPPGPLPKQPERRGGQKGSNSRLVFRVEAEQPNAAVVRRRQVVDERGIVEQPKLTAHRGSTEADLAGNRRGPHRSRREELDDPQPRRIGQQREP